MHLQITHRVFTARVGVYRAEITYTDAATGKVVARDKRDYKGSDLENVARRSIKQAYKRARALGATSIEVESNAITPYVPRDLKPAEKVKRWYLQDGTERRS